MSVKSLVGDIDVQVKGSVNNKKPDTAKRLVEIEKLRYYHAHGGVLYFFVLENNTCDTVYYKLLLPFDISRILRDHPNQEKVTLRFDRFPTEPGEITRLIAKAIRDKRDQQPSVALGYCSMDEYEKNGLNFSECGLTIDVAPNETMASLEPYKSGVYIYGKEASGLKFPIDKIENLVSVAIGRRLTVAAGEVSFEAVVLIGESEAVGQFFEFDGFRVVLGEEKTIYLDEKGSLSTRLRDVLLMREMWMGLPLRLGGKIVLRGLTPDRGSGFDKLNERIEALREIDAVMKRLHVKMDLDIAALSDQNLCDLASAYKGLIKGELLHRPNMQSGACMLRLPGFNVKLLLINQGSDDYLLVDTLDMSSSKFQAVISDDEGKPLASVPSLLIQPKDELLELGNIDAEVFKRACELVPITERSSGFATDAMLGMISAADEKAVCSTELLKCCAILVELLEPFCEPEVTTINRLQIKKRMSGLDPDDENALVVLIAASEDKQAKACAAILRGDVLLARALIDKLPVSQAEELCSWPVYHFLEIAENG